MVVIDGRVVAAVGDVVQHDSSNSPLESDYNQKYTNEIDSIPEVTHTLLETECLTV
jgi:hypothetical protein